jgi:hypothetical protein
MLLGAGRGGDHRHASGKAAQGVTETADIKDFFAQRDLLNAKLTTSGAFSPPR